MLDVFRLEVAYGDRAAIAGVSLASGSGSLLVLLGGRGAGKSTLLRALSGGLPDVGATLMAGRVVVDEADVSHLTTREARRRGIALVPTWPRVFPSLTVAETLRLGGLALTGARARREARERVLGLLPFLAASSRTRAGSLNAGEQSLLAIAAALMCGPRLLLLDEPSRGLSPVAATTLASLLGELHRQGQSIVLAEQHVPLGLAVATEAAVLVDGRLLRSGPPEELGTLQELVELCGPVDEPGTRPERAPRHLERWVG